MNRFIVTIFIVLIATTAFGADSPVPVNELFKNLDRSKHTTSQIEKYQKMIIGAKVEGIGAVADVQEKRKARKKSRPGEVRSEPMAIEYYTIYTYCGKQNNIGKNIVRLRTTQDASNIGVGQKIKFIGELAASDSSQEITIVLTNGEFEMVE
jgi:hypothetical protein